MLSITAVIQARTGSSRLPGKVLMKIDDKNPLMYYVIKQLNYSEHIDKIIVATTIKKEDDKIEEFCHENEISCFRGDTDNVLDRYYKCSKQFSLENIARITCDNPLIDPHIVDKVLKKFKNQEFDLVTNVFPRSFPYGTEVEVFSRIALERAWKDAKSLEEREHVTKYFYNNSERFRIFNISNSSDLTNYRWTVDTKADFELVKKIFSKIKKSPIFMEDILYELERTK